MKMRIAGPCGARTNCGELNDAILSEEGGGHGRIPNLGKVGS